ncbi:MAG: CvpA family protein [Bacillota bacterium]|nr:CvpA family protein [Bacillota bacterium]
MVIDIITIAVFVFCVLAGAKRGFARAILGFFSYLVSCVIGFIFYNKISEMLYKWDVSSGIIKRFKENISDKVINYTQSHEGNMPVFFNKTVEKFNGNASEAISNAASHIAVSIVVIIGVIVAVKILSILLAAVVKLPVLKQCNSILGGAVGAINGVIVCYIFGALILFFLINANNTWIAGQLDKSVLGSYFYKNNLILNLIIGV